MAMTFKKLEHHLEPGNNYVVISGKCPTATVTAGEALGTFLLQSAANNLGGSDCDGVAFLSTPTGIVCQFVPGTSNTMTGCVIRMYRGATAGVGLHEVTGASDLSSLGAIRLRAIIS